MAVMSGHAPVTSFEQWYTSYEIDERDGTLDFRGMQPCASAVWNAWQEFKREMDLRVQNYEVLEKIADGEVIRTKPDLPNVSSGETAGIVRRVARSLVQNAPNVEVVSIFDDSDAYGIFAKFVLTSRIIGSDHYSNDFQQSLIASTKSSFTLGFDCVIPALLEDPAGGWYIKYDSINYRDVFPDPGCKDIRESSEVFIRRYLTRGDVIDLLRNRAVGWDLNALKTLLKRNPGTREWQSVDHQTKKRGQIPLGYEVITLYTNSGDPFLTFDGRTKMLLRIEKNKHPLKQHPVHFLVLEKDAQQPLGKSQVELLIGRQDFQDLMLNGAMKLWYRNINPSIIGYGTINALPNLSPGKYTEISNPNARIEPFEVNTQTLLQYNSISQANLGSMVNMVGAPDQQMQQAAGGGMSATPQGVEAQGEVVDITTNNYQKAIEGFVSHYCSYALTLYFAELQAVQSVRPTAEARIRLRKAGLEEDVFKDDGTLDIDFSKLATMYWVRCIPGSLVELEDEKELRLLNQLFVPLSQAMPAMAASQNQDMINQAASAMSYIINRQIQLSGAADAMSLSDIFSGKTDAANARDERIALAEQAVTGLQESHDAEMELLTTAVRELQDKVSTLIENNQLLTEKLGVYSGATTDVQPAAPAPAVPMG